MTALFNAGDFELHSGGRSRLLIDCDALTDDDLAALAEHATTVLPPFGGLLGVARGGLRFAKALEPHVTDGPLLIVDDVLTTGASMEQFRVSQRDIGVVIFARGDCPSWVTPLLALTLPEPPCSCGGDRWVDDEGWQPEDYERAAGRVPGAGRIPCGFCNHGGWDVPDGQEAKANA